MALKCDPDVSDISEPKIYYDLTDETFDVTLETSSKHACPTFNFSAIWDWMTANKWYGFAIVFCFGVAECFFGLRLKNFTLGSMGFVVLLLVIMVFFVEFIITPDSEDWLMWVALSTAILFGALGAFLTIKF